MGRKLCFKILARFEYCGHTVNFKTYSKSNKLKKRYENTPENRRIFRNTHEAIIDEKLFERVQELEGKQTPPRQASGTARAVFQLNFLR